MVRAQHRRSCAGRGQPARHRRTAERFGAAQRARNGSRSGAAWPGLSGPAHPGPARLGPCVTTGPVRPTSPPPTVTPCFYASTPQFSGEPGQWARGGPAPIPRAARPVIDCVPLGMHRARRARPPSHMRSSSSPSPVKEGRSGSSGWPLTVTVAMQCALCSISHDDRRQQPRQPSTAPPADSTMTASA